MSATEPTHPLSIVGSSARNASALKAALRRAKAEAKAAHAEAEELNRQLLEAQRIGKMGHWIVDRATNTVRWSPQIFEIAGMDPVPQLSVRQAEAAVHSVDREAFIATLRRAKATRQTLTLEHRWVRSNGEIRDVQMILSAQYDDDGACTHFFGTAQDITDRKRTEEALRQAKAEAEAARAEAEASRRLTEEANKQLLEAQRIGEIGHWMSDEITKTVNWSPQMFEIAGLPPVPVLTFAAARGPIHPDDLPAFVAIVKRVIIEQCNVTLEHRWVRPDGEIRHVHVGMSPTYDSSGVCLHLLGTARDITERKTAEIALKAAQRQLIDAIEAISEGFVLFDGDGRFVLANEAYHRLWPGLRDVLVPGTQYETITRAAVERGFVNIGEEDPESYITRTVAWQRNGLEPVERRLADGRWIRLMARRTRDGAVVGIRTDITATKTAEIALVRQVADLEVARRRLERLSFDLTAMADELAGARDAAEEKAAALVRSEARFRDFALTSSHWLWETDARHRFTYVSDGVRTFGFSSESLVGRTRREIAADADRDPEKWLAFQTVLDNHGPFRDFAFAWRNPSGGEGVASVSGDPFFDAAGRLLGYRGTGRDITRQILTENALIEAKQAAEAANLSKSQFLANMSHELRTPLNAIIGFSEMIEVGMKGPVTPVYQEYAKLIHQSGAHLHQVINDILDLAKVDAGKIELRQEEGVDPRQIAEACTKLVRGHAETAEIELSLAADDTLPLIIADTTRLKQILLNLLSNAIKFTGPGGSVRLTVHRADHGGAVFEVCDTGSGMTPEEIEIALEPFGQVKTDAFGMQEGTGLGLPLARRLAEFHGGSLSIVSQKGCGTTVSVILPAGGSATLLAEAAE
jgi:PAS domain S-box-containing protein